MLTCTETWGEKKKMMWRSNSRISGYLRALWIGKYTCWVRLADWRRYRNCWVWESVEISTWISKSPVINSCSVVAAMEMQVWKSVRNWENESKLEVAYLRHQEDDRC